VLISRRDARNWAAWTDVIGVTASANSANGHGTENGHAHNGTSAALNGSGTASEEAEAEEDDTIENRTVFRNISGYITSDSVLLFRDIDTANTTANTTERAISIPYPSISLHAIQRVPASSPIHGTSAEPRTYHSSSLQPTSQTQAQTSALYLQLDLGNPFTRNPDLDEDAAETVDLLLIPQTSSTPTRATADAGTITEPPAIVAAGGTDGPSAQSQELQADTKTIFEALTRCADLHPDPDDVDSDEAGGEAGDLMGGGMPGAGGWITSENVHEFEGMFGGGDDEGDGLNGVDGGEGEDEAVVRILGPGAGSRRARDDDAEETVATREADEEGDGESKWRRTS